MLEDLNQKWDSIVKKNICIPSHEIIIGDENEIPQYIKTNFLSDISIFDVDSTTSDTIIGNTSQTLVLDDEIEEPDNDTENFVFESSERNHLPILSNKLSKESLTFKQFILNTFNNNFTQNELISIEAMIISFVLRDVPTTLQEFDTASQILKRLESRNLVASGIFIEKVSSIKEQLSKSLNDSLSELKNKISEWERSFAKENNLSIPSMSDVIDNTSIEDISIRIEVGNKVLCDWATSFSINDTL